MRFNRSTGWAAGIASFIVVLGLVCVVGVRPASADTVVDPQIFFCQSCSSPTGADPAVITNPSAFNVGVAGGKFILQDPLLIIVGEYNSIGTPTVTYAGGVSTPAITTYGLTKTTAAFNSTSSGDAYDQLGLASGGSQSFGNWSAGDVKDGFATPSSFTLHVFALNANLSSGTPITIGVSGATAGSYIIAYDCENGTGSSSGCATNGDIGQTPFTNSGNGLGGTGQFVTPEPATLTLFGSGLIGIAGLMRRRRQVA